MQKLGFSALCCLAGLAAILLSCTESPAPSSGQSTQASAAAQPRPQLPGGDTRAWLTARGDLADSGFCRAELAVPLARTPAWVAEYSVAEFSSEMPDEMLHYDGLFLLTANSSQLMGIDVASGRIDFNRDLYQHYDRDVATERFLTLFATPGGFIIGRDDVGRHYCWDIADREPRQQWVGVESRPDNGFVADDQSIYTSYFEDVRRLDTVSGSTDWEIPTLALRGGVVMADNGTLIWWSRQSGQALAMNAADGKQLWQYATPDMIDLIIVDNANQRFYMFLESESVQCRELASFELLWEFGWRAEMDAAERATLIAESGWAGFYLLPSAASVLPDGVALALSSGQVFRLNTAGELVWRYDSEAAVRDMLAFENGLLISEFYTAAQTTPWGPLLAIMSRTAPQWSEVAEARANGVPVDSGSLDQETVDSAISAGKPVKVGYSRTVVLDLASGAPLDVFEPELFPYTAMIPAGDKVIYGEIVAYYAYLGQQSEVAPRRILAYPWIKQGDG